MSAGATRAADIIRGANVRMTQSEYRKWLIETIDRETHSAEVIDVLKQISAHWEMNDPKYNVSTVAKSIRALLAK